MSERKKAAMSGFVTIHGKQEAENIEGIKSSRYINAQLSLRNGTQPVTLSMATM